MKFTGKVVGKSFDMQGKLLVTFLVNEKNDALSSEDLNAEKLTLDVKKFREKRSLDANAYAWVLLDRLSEKMGIPKIEIYREIVRNIGGNSDIVCVKEKAVDRLCEGWRKNGIGWVTDVIPSKIQGCKNVVLYTGSSEYDSAQMARLIESIISECKEQGIQTETPAELQRMVDEWR